MDANSTIIRHWEDVVFEYRNKSYGAYVLRRAYSNRLLTGVVFTLVFVALVLSLQRIFSGEAIPVAPHVIPEPRPVISPPPSIIRSHPPRGSVPEVSNVQNRAVVVTREIVDAPVVDAIIDFVSDGDVMGDVGVPEGEGISPVVDVPAVVAEPKVVDIAEIMPSYEGGLETMMKFIRKKIHYPRSARQSGSEGTVYVQFIVTGGGAVTDVRIMRGFHPECDREAQRVVAMLPGWKGGSNNGTPVSVRMVLPIKFNLSDN
jgi:protein TonB